MDMKGNVLNTWKGSLISLLDSGDIIAKYIKKIDRHDLQLRPVWESDFEIHHEILLTHRKTILTITSEEHKYIGE